MNTPPKLHLHADDFGMTDYSNEKILDCARSGGLNGISLLPDGQALPETLPEGLFCCIHLDLVEGKAVSRPEEIPLLADENGFFRNSFVQLLQKSLAGSRSAFAAQLRLEIRNQLLRIRPLIPEGGAVGLDSHQHTHMIPLVMSALLDLAEELRLPVAYVRIPAEPLLPFLRHPSLWCTYRPVNLVKSLVLRTLFLFSSGRYRRSGIPTQVFFGIMLSGNMDGRRVRLLLPDFLRIAEKRHQGLEVLFHPGAQQCAADCMDRRKSGFVSFYLSDGRKEEYAALRSFGAAQAEGRAPRER